MLRDNTCPQEDDDGDEFMDYDFESYDDNLTRPNLPSRVRERRDYPKRNR